MSDEEMEQLLAAIHGDIGGAWSNAVEYLRSENDVSDIQAKLEAGNIHDAVTSLEGAAEKFAHAVNNGYLVSGSTAAAKLAKDAETPIVFDATNHGAVTAMRQNTVDLVRAISTEQRSMIQQVVVDGLNDRQAPAQIARTIRDSIGLTPTQEQHVANYRAQLESSSSTDLYAAMQRELADGRYDRAVQRAIDSGKPIDPDRIDKMVDTYRDNYVQLRAETIARTESLRAVHEGTQQLYTQAIDNGDIAAENMVRTWHSGNSSRTRDSHRAMDGQKRGMDEPFESGNGNALMYPGDPSAPANDTVNCRCTVSVRYAPTASTAASPSSASAVPDAIESEPTAPIPVAATPRPVTENELADHRQSFLDRTTTDQQAAAYTYSTSAYEDINGHLRGLLDTPLTGGPLDTVKNVISHLDSALAATPIDAPVITYRYSSSEDVFDALQPGDVFQDKGFTSTTIDKKVTNLMPITFTITSPAGTKLGAIPSAYELEKEMLLARGTSFQVDSRDVDSNGNIHFHITVIGQQS